MKQRSQPFWYFSSRPKMKILFGLPEITTHFFGSLGWETRVSAYSFVAVAAIFIFSRVVSFSYPAFWSDQFLLPPVFMMRAFSIFRKRVFACTGYVQTQTRRCTERGRDTFAHDVGCTQRHRNTRKRGFFTDVGCTSSPKAVFPSE